MPKTDTKYVLLLTICLKTSIKISVNMYIWHTAVYAKWRPPYVKYWHGQCWKNVRPDYDLKIVTVCPSAWWFQIKEDGWSTN